MKIKQDILTNTTVLQIYIFRFQIVHEQNDSIMLTVA